MLNAPVTICIYLLRFLEHQNFLVDWGSSYRLLPLPSLSLSHCFISVAANTGLPGDTSHGRGLYHGVVIDCGSYWMS